MTGNESILVAVRKGYFVDIYGNVIAPSGNFLAKQVNRSGYHWFRPGKNCGTVAVHRLQAFQKFGDAIFQDGVHCRHLNGNKDDNSSANIAIGTASENQMDKPAEIRRSAAVTASRAAMRHDHGAIVAALRDGLSYRAIMDRFGIRSKGTISFIAKRSLASQSI